MNIPSHPAPSDLQNMQAPPIPMDDLIKVHRELTAKKKELEDKYKAEAAPYVEALEKVNAKIYTQMQASGADSVKTTNGTAYFSTTLSYGIEDPEAYRMFVQASGVVDAYENRPSKAFIENYIEQHNVLPPGVKQSSFTKVNVRK